MTLNCTVLSIGRKKHTSLTLTLPDKTSKLCAFFMIVIAGVAYASVLRQIFAFISAVFSSNFTCLISVISDSNCTYRQPYCFMFYQYLHWENLHTFWRRITVMVFLFIWISDSFCGRTVLHGTGSVSKLMFFPGFTLNSAHASIWTNVWRVVCPVSRRPDYMLLEPCVSLAYTAPDDWSEGYGFMLKLRRQVKPWARRERHHGASVLDPRDEVV